MASVQIPAVFQNLVKLLSREQLEQLLIEQMTQGAIANAVGSSVTFPNSTTVTLGTLVVGKPKRGRKPNLVKQGARDMAKLLKGTAKPAKAPKAAKAKGAKRTEFDMVLVQETVLDCIRANSKSGVEQIGKLAGLSTKELALPIKKLLTSGFIKKHGVKRATRYEIVEHKAPKKHTNGVAAAAE